MKTGRKFIEQAWESPSEFLSPALGKNGFCMPAIRFHRWVSIGNIVDDNWLVMPHDIDQDRFKIDFRGKANVIVYGRRSTLHGNVTLHGSFSTIIIGEDTGPGSAGLLNIYGRGDRSLVFVGRCTSTNVTNVFVSTGRTVVIGEDCMLASAVNIRSHDDHALIDMNTGGHLNQPADILINPHVWLCPEVTVLKGVEIGFGSVVAAKALVNKDVPPFSLMGGVPAKVLKTDVSWDRTLEPRPGRRKDLTERFQNLKTTAGRAEAFDKALL